MQRTQRKPSSLPCSKCSIMPTMARKSFSARKKRCLLPLSTVAGTTPMKIWSMSNAISIRPAAIWRITASKVSRLVRFHPSCATSWGWSWPGKCGVTGFRCWWPPISIRGLITIIWLSIRSVIRMARSSTATSGPFTKCGRSPTSCAVSTT